MSSSKLNKKHGAQTPAATCASTSIASKLSAWATTSNGGEDANGSLPATTESISMKQLVDELAKQRGGLKDDVSHLIQESLKPLETAVGALRDTVGSFQAGVLVICQLGGASLRANGGPLSVQLQ